MRIAQVAPLALPVPPGRYGGTERVVYDLTEALVEGGHEVTLFASGDSRSSARLVAVVPRALWQEARTDAIAADTLLHALVFGRAGEFDLIHTHTGFSAFPFLAQARAPVLTTLHGRLDIGETQALLQLFPAARLVSISRSQQAQAPDAGWAGNVYHGLPLADYRFDAQGGDRLLFLGRMCAEKAPQVAIDIAVEAGLPLTLAGRIDPIEQDFFEREVRPRLDHPLIRFAGEVSHDEKLHLLRSARALLFPIDWPEPFGLVMIEAMACGTPVVARPKGSVPELVLDGVTGVLADDRAALVDAVRRVQQIDRGACRRHVEAHFSIAAMTAGYLALYEQLTEAPGTLTRAPH